MNVFSNNRELMGLYKHESLMITDERQLDIIIEDPTKSLAVEDERGFSSEDHTLYEDNDSLVDKIRKAKENGANVFEISYDFFWGGTTRTLFPDSEKTIKAFKVVHDLAKEYGMGFSASIINPLDIGGEYVKNHKDIGYSWQYKEGEIKEDGTYHVEIERQVQWMNNKGPVSLELDRVVVYAFKEERIENSFYYYVNPDEILDISKTASYEIGEKVEISQRGYGKGELTIYGKWKKKLPGYERCLAIAVYRTREIDYFGPDAFSYVKSIVDKHAEAGITYQGFYSDEMHIQFDWGLDTHFGLTEVSTRYVTENLAKEYSKRYGKEYADFAKYLVYFSYHQHDFMGNEEGKLANQHVMGKTPEGIYKTWLFRKRYFEMLNTKVVSLCTDVKKYAEELFGNQIICRGHATWVESPTLDRNYEDACYLKMHDEKYSRYDYHKNYYYSSSVIEAMAACYNYFTWNDYYTGGGTDHGEDGYSDRNYYSQAFGASLAELNSFHYGYAGTWGSPDYITRCFNAVGKAYGVGSWDDDYCERVVQGFEGRLTDVLAVYPLDLLYAEERFGSWMVQYGYCNYITEDKLLEYGHVNDNGRLQVKGREYRALVVMFQPFVQEKTLLLLEKFLHSGGKVLWMSIPPVMDSVTEKKPEKWKELFGIETVQEAVDGLGICEKHITFDSRLSMKDMPVLSDFLPDYVYPVKKAENTEAIAFFENQIVGVEKSYENGGCAVYTGFRVRDDQSGSTGCDVATLFELLNYMGAYSKDGGEVLTRPEESKFVINRFPNGAVSLANHYRTFYEHWDGRYFRDERDEKYLEGRELPSIDICLNEKELFGHVISYTGTDTLTYHLTDKNELTGFAGMNCTGICLDGKEYSFLNTPGRLAWSVVEPAHFISDVKSAIVMKSDYVGEIRIPNALVELGLEAYRCTSGLFSDMVQMLVKVNETEIVLEQTEQEKNHWIVIFKRR